MPVLDSTIQTELANRLPPPYFPAYDCAGSHQFDDVPAEIRSKVGSLLGRAYDASYNRIQNARDPMLRMRTWGDWLDVNADIYEFIGATQLWTHWPVLANCFVETVNRYYGFNIQKPAIW